MNDQPVTRQEHEDRIQRLTRHANVNGCIPILSGMIFAAMGGGDAGYLVICLVTSWMLWHSMRANVANLDQMGDMMFIADAIKTDRDNLEDLANEKDQTIEALLAKVRALDAEIAQIGIKAQAASDSMDLLRIHVKNQPDVTLRTFNHNGLQQGQTPSANYQQG